MTIHECMDAGATRIRLPKWINPDAHLELHRCADGAYGVWATLWDEWGQRACDIPFGSQKVLLITLESDDWEIYEPPPGGAEETSDAP